MLCEIFVGKIFVLKNFCRVNVLRKYFNTKFCNSVAKARDETYGESNCHGRDFRKEMLYSRLPRI